MSETYVNGHEKSLVNSNETAARVVAYLSPYLFWVTVVTIIGGIWLIQ